MLIASLMPLLKSLANLPGVSELSIPSTNAFLTVACLTLSPKLVPRESSMVFNALVTNFSFSGVAKSISFCASNASALVTFLSFLVDTTKSFSKLSCIAICRSLSFPPWLSLLAIKRNRPFCLVVISGFLDSMDRKSLSFSLPVSLARYLSRFSSGSLFSVTPMSSSDTFSLPKFSVPLLTSS